MLRKASAKYGEFGVRFSQKESGNEEHLMAVLMVEKLCRRRKIANMRVFICAAETSNEVDLKGL